MKLFIKECSPLSCRFLCIRIVSGHTMKVYLNGGIGPHILNHGARWRWVLSFTNLLLCSRGKFRRYPLNRRLVGPRAGLVTFRIRRDADKSLARPGRKQATTTKLGIYSTYSPRSSIHFLARCSNVCKPLKKKKIRKLSVQPGLRGSNDLRVGRKMAKFQFFFYSPGNRW